MHVAFEFCFKYNVTKESMVSGIKKIPTGVLKYSLKCSREFLFLQFDKSSYSYSCLVIKCI